ncbi:MAG TPA: hypothetical protein VM096_15190 [Vicinamibacterales bacterium]|nr:hypothetical protein [Vicinamibacterales bacterium]
MILFFASFLFLAQVAAPPSPAQNVSPAKPTVEPTPDPASVHFLADTGLLLVAIKPAAVADYEEVLRTLQEALAKDANATRVSAAKGWRVYKAAEPDAKGNTLYIHIMRPTVTGFDYRPSLLLDELITDLAPELLSKYQEAFATPPSKLNLTELANMSVTPVPATKKPGGR